MGIKTMVGYAFGHPECAAGDCAQPGTQLVRWSDNSTSLLCDGHFAFASTIVVGYKAMISA